MIKKLLLTLGIVLFCSSLAFSQGTIKGKVTDQGGGAIEFANVLLKKEGSVVNYAMTDGDGNYQLHGVPAGTYDITFDATLITSCGKQETETGVKISNGQDLFVNHKINCSSQSLDEVTVIWKEPVFRADNTKTSTTLSAEDIKQTPGRSITRALASSEGVTSVDGSLTSVRGARSDGQKTMIDGMVVRGSGGISMASVEQAELIQGGIPAEYGDGTSFMVITTKGISKNLHGSAELRGNIDGYNNFLGEVSLTGPILKGKKAGDPARIGFMVTGDVSLTHDGSPARGGTWRATEETIDYLIKNPLRYSATEIGANYANGEYLTEESFYKKRVRDNAGGQDYLGQAKLDFLLGSKKNIDLSIGGMYEYTRGKSWGRGSALFNAQNNSFGTTNTWRINTKFQHRIPLDTNSVFENIMYNINVNFTHYNTESQDSRHRKNLFNYGHIGYYKTTRAKYFTHLGPGESINIDSIDYYGVTVLSNIYDSLVEYSPTPWGSNDESLISNPDLIYYVTNFTNQFTPSTIYDYFGLIPYDLTLYQQFGALINGTGPGGYYGLFSAPGTVSNGYSRGEESQIGANVSLSMTVKNHDIKLGYQFEKRTSRSFSVSPVGLWTLMRSSANSHISELDKENPYFVGGYDTVMYDMYFDAEAQTTFDRNLRTSLGLDPNGTDWIDVDNLDPNTFELSMFSPGELFNGGNTYISYYGYDYIGSKKTKTKTNIEQFFTEKDANGDYTYRVGAYEPVYMAMYIQDKFSIQSLLFNVGVRIDRFDANQSVLKDPYLFRDSYTVGEVRGSFDSKYIPGNAADDWVVYVNQQDGVLDPENTNIVAFRSGNTWYDANGAEVKDPTTVLGATGGPILKKALPATYVSKVDYDAFEDYKPQWSVMPRLSFSFPVSNKSLFYAHYNIITSRPGYLRLDPISYLWIEKYNTPGASVNNPRLKPSKTIDYELGFRQAIGESSALSLAAYYREERDMIQAYRYSGAYPTTYYSYDNIDFGTVQGFTVAYDLQRTKNITLRASYTLQFAKGTGSSATSGLAIISSGQPNLRTLTNLSFDQRHKLAAILDYRFGWGGDYNGPTVRKEKNGKVKETKVLEGFGVNVNFSAGSGMPYSRSSKPYSIYVSGTNSQLSGTINGSNMPWIFQCDLRINKSFMLSLKKDEKGETTKRGFLDVYLEVMNLFNFKNVIYVYEYTGNADDDGYLTATEYQQQINSQVSVASYSNYYRMIMQDPYNYTRPIRVILGVSFSF